jgi:DNA processing protein
MSASVYCSAAVLALVEAIDRIPGASRHRLSDLLEVAGSPQVLLGGEASGLELLEAELAARLVAEFDPDAQTRWETELTQLAGRHSDIAVLTVCDDAFPSNLRQTYDRTPFLFVRGQILEDDARAIAVVGTRRPSPEGIEQADRLGRRLAEAGVTVVSGLAEGVDTAAHLAALAAGGRTVAVLGHGIEYPVYPASNRGLADRISAAGALVSQFWPQGHPTAQTFPMRNVTTSGLSLGTVVVEAGETSGARQQARRCLEHGKQLFLLDRLVTHQEWARRYAERPGVVVIRDVDEVLGRVETLSPRTDCVQLTFA